MSPRACSPSRPRPLPISGNGVESIRSTSTRTCGRPETRTATTRWAFAWSGQTTMRRGSRSTALACCSASMACLASTTPSTTATCTDRSRWATAHSRLTSYAASSRSAMIVPTRPCSTPPHPSSCATARTAPEDPSSSSACSVCPSANGSRPGSMPPIAR